MDNIQEIKDRIRVMIFEATSTYINSTNDDKTKGAVRTIITNVLRDSINSGLIPPPYDNEPVLVEVSTDKNDPNKISITLPEYLRVLFSVTDDCVFEHDCTKCIFLGHGLGYDLYFCNQNDVLPTVIARASSNPSDYQSGMVAAKNMTIDEPLGLAYWLARRHKFVN